MAIASLSVNTGVSSVLPPGHDLDVFGMAMTSLSVAAGVSSVLLSPVRLGAARRDPDLLRSEVAGLGKVSFCINNQLNASRFPKLSVSHKPRLSHITRGRCQSWTCSAALNATCATEGQTQTVEKPTSVIQNAPGKEKSPLLDDGGSGFPPRDDGDGGGGGGGGGGNYSGGFFFFGFLAFLGFLKDRESEGDYDDSRRR